MAEFCKDCSILIFGEDFGDLKGLVSKGKTQDQIDKGIQTKDLVVPVVCEGCGFIYVNEAGECCSKDCIGEHRQLKLKPKTVIKKPDPDDDIEF